MDNYDEKLLEELREKLKPLDESVELPEGLSAAAVEKRLGQEKRKKTIKRWQKAVAWASAAAVLAFCGVTLYRQLGSNPLLTNTPSPQEQSTQQNGVEATDAVLTGTAVSAAADTGETFRMTGETYDSILKLVRSYAQEQKSYNLRGIFDGMQLNGAKSMDDAAPEAAMDGDMAVTYAASAEADRGAGSSASGAADHAETNVQVAGVDEADILKNDGEYLYLLSNGMVHIAKAYPAESMELVSTIRLPESERPKPADDEVVVYDNEVSYSTAESRIYQPTAWANEMFLYNQYLVLLTTDYAYEETGSYAKTVAYLYDISDRSAPVLAQTFGQDGYYVSSRITGGRLVLVTTHGGFFAYNYGTVRTTCEVVEDRVIPKTYDNAVEGTRIAEESLAIADSETPTEFVIASVKNLDDLDAPASTQAILGGGSEIYCTADTLFVARRTWNWSDDLTTLGIGIPERDFNGATEIFAFGFGDGSIAHTASGCVPGFPLNQFSMDLYDGCFRIAVNTGSANAVYCLNDALTVIGSVEGFAEDETIRSVRFLGKTAYVVTFLQTDPLFVIDLSDPTAPFIAGELKIPGFSAYLHPVGDGLVLGVGYGGTEEGLDGSAKLSLFDVSDPVNPREADVLVVENADINTESRAFVPVSDGSFLLTLTRHKSREVRDEYGTYVSYTPICGALRVAVAGARITLLNTYEGGEEYTSRVTYIDRTVYTFSQWGKESLRAFDMDTAETLATLGLEPS